MPLERQTGLTRFLDRGGRPACGLVDPDGPVEKAFAGVRELSARPKETYGMA